MTEGKTDDLFALFYAAVSTIEAGQVKEADIERTTTTESGAVLALRVVIRAEVQPLISSGPDDG